MIFQKFAQRLQKLEKTSSRLDMTSQLADLFGQLEKKEIPPACYLMQGELVPRYKSLEFNMSDKLTIRAIAQLVAQEDEQAHLPDTNLFNEQDYSLYQQQIEKKYKQEGDLGLAAQNIIQKVYQEKDDTEQRGQATIVEIHQALIEIAQDEGEGSQDRKIHATKRLLVQLDPLSVRYVVRVIVGNLRLGFSTMTMLDALSWAQFQKKTDRKRLEAAYNKKADIGSLAQGYLACQSESEIAQFLNNYEVEVGIPVVPALCQRLNTAQEIIEKMSLVIAEPKYDGLRAQIHVDKSKNSNYQVYTRNMDNVTHMFPELKQAIQHLDCEQCILDAEAIAYDKKTGKLLPFQKTITRKRKHGIVNQAETVPIKFYVFDILLKDQTSFVSHTLDKRKQVLSQVIADNTILKATDYIETDNPVELKKFHHQQLELGLEGAVIKRTDSKYKGGRKGWRWVKIKEVEGKQGKLSDTLDCVVMGYYRGKGKRAQFGIGAFLVGVIDQDNQIKTIAKIGTGLTDKQFKKIKNMADEKRSEDKSDQYDVPEDLYPDVWVYPEIVVEIAADELTDSPLHSAGQALRFPRLVGFRPDKDWDQATTVKELERIEVS